MSNDLEKLGDSFIVNDDLEHEEIKALVTRALKFSKVDKKGYVIIPTPSKFKIVDKILLVLSTRFLGNKLQQKIGQETSIKEEVTVDELCEILKEKRAVVFARLKDLRDNNSIEALDRGVYKIHPHAINSFLSQIEASSKNGN